MTKPGPKPVDPVFRFFARLLATEEDGCWLWPGSLNNRGYGQFNDGQRVVLAHRFSYVVRYGVVPDGMQLDHLCRNRACVRPDHLEPVTAKVNNQRGEAASRTRAWRGAQTHCKRGHELPEPDQAGVRICRPCRAASSAAYRARKGT